MFPKESHHNQRHQGVSLWLGSAFIAPNLELLAAPMEQLNRRLRILVLPVGVPPAIGRDLAHRAVVAVMPLVDDASNARKCGYKRLQYSAIAIPLVSSAVGPARKIAETLEALAARTALEQQTVRFEILGLSSTNDRHRIGQRHERLVQRHFSDKAWEGEFSRPTSVKQRQ